MFQRLFVSEVKVDNKIRPFEKTASNIVHLSIQRKTIEHKQLYAQLK